MTVSLPNRVDSAHIETRYRVDRDCAGLDDTPASTTDRDFLLEHLGREVLHGSVMRDFKKAYRRNKAGEVSPRMYRTDSEALGKCEYVKLTSKQYAAVLVGGYRPAGRSRRTSRRPCLVRAQCCAGAC